MRGMRVLSALSKSGGYKMKTYFSEMEWPYDGSQLKHLYAYMNFKILGDSVVAWVGPCNVQNIFMADGEDLLAGSEIRGDRMVHFILEKYDIDFFAAVSLQRLISSLAIDVLRQHAGQKEIALQLRRDGDDIYYNNKKLSISIAKKFVNSGVIHFAVNVVNDGTPVETLSLGDLSIDPVLFAKKLLEKIKDESESIRDATQKVL